ncbi:MAG: ABC transporter ATP-binding protein [Solirubrobacterales bacterium]
MPGAGPAVRAEGLRKEFGQTVALDGLDLLVDTGEIVAVLGPNGAGKTTLLTILEGLLQRDGGAVEVLGVDPAAADPDWRERIGIVLQETALEPLLTVRESLELYAGYYRDPMPPDELIELVGLEDSTDVRAGRLSGGQRRRLDVGIAMSGRPELLFLDEPTTGFDPAARRSAWAMIAGLRERATTVLLTTHYMEEAAELADRVVIVDDGRVVAQGTPAGLGSERGLKTAISFRLPVEVEPGDLTLPGGGSLVRDDSGTCSLETDRPTADLAAITAWAGTRGIELDELSVRPPSLEDVYLELTG